MNFSNDYPDNWKEIAIEVKESADWRCVRCGHKHSPPSDPQPCDEHCDGDRHPGGLGDGKQRVLTVHHLTGQKDLNTWWNCLALCQVCHLVIQAKVNVERPWLMFEHSEWFRPYVAGWYAYRYSGENISRVEAETRMAELLLLEKQAFGIGGGAEDNDE